MVMYAGKYITVDNQGAKELLIICVVTIYCMWGVSFNGQNFCDKYICDYTCTGVYISQFYMHLCT